MVYKTCYSLFLNNLDYFPAYFLVSVNLLSYYKVFNTKDIWSLNLCSIYLFFQLYFDIKDILKDYPALLNDFIAFLRPEQARECGKYKEYLTLSKIREFIRKIEVSIVNEFIV